MKRVWKPLDIRGLRLYEVRLLFPSHPECNQCLAVVAESPRQAARLIETMHKDANWLFGSPIIMGYPLNVYQPESWQEGDDDES